MKSFKDELAKIIEGNDESAAVAFEKFCAKYAGSLPLPGENREFDKAMWIASEHAKLSASDENIVKKVTSKLLGEKKDVMAASALRLKDLIGQGKEAAINTWQDMLAAMSWNQMVPAGAMRGVGAQMVSLGTFQKDVSGANIQVNIGWLVDKEHLRVLLQAKDNEQQALPNVELRIKEADRGVIYSRMTNDDGAVVAPNVHVGPGQYQIQILFMDQVAETPYFIV